MFEYMVLLHLALDKNHLIKNIKSGVLNQGVGGSTFQAVIRTIILYIKELALWTESMEIY